MHLRDEGKKNAYLLFEPGLISDFLDNLDNNKRNKNGNKEKENGKSIKRYG